jgi:signal transduction histidine kinase
MLSCDDLVGMGVEDFSRRFRVSYPNGALLPADKFISQRVFDEAGPLAHKIVVYPEPGRELVISAKASAVRMDQDEPPDLVVSEMHDITDASQFDRLRDDFFAAAAHSLKTPVAVIKANAEIVSVGDAAVASASAAAIKRQCDRIDLLLQNLLVLARVGSNTLQLYPRDVDSGRSSNESSNNRWRRGRARSEVRSRRLAARPRRRGAPQRWRCATWSTRPIVCRRRIRRSRS